MSNHSPLIRNMKSAAAVLCLLSASALPPLANAGVAQDAYNACQTQLKVRYGDGARVTLKRTRERGSKVTVKMQVNAAGHAFVSTCVVHRSGQITLTGEDGRLFEAVAANTTLEG